MRTRGASEESGGGRGPRCLLLSSRRLLGGWYLAGLILVAAALVATLASSAVGQAPQAQTMRTERMRLVYLSENHGYVVPHLSRCFENSLRFHGDLFDYEPDGDVTVILQDADDHGYAGTTAMPRNYLTLGIEPFEHVYGTCPTNERMNWVMNHELVHLVASDQATRGDLRWRWIFQGKVTPAAEDPLSIFYSYLTNPRRYAPRWYHEGVAVFLETWMSGGIGRAQNGYDEMVFRTMVRDSVDFYDIVGIESEGTASDFQTGQLSYLYGARFVCYLALMYGPEKVIEWVQRTDGSKAYFSAQFRRVFDVSLDDEWRRWVAWERAWQRENLELLRQYPTTGFRALSDFPLGSVSRGHHDPNTDELIAAVRYPGEFAHIRVLDLASGESRKICDIRSPGMYYVASLAYDPTSRTVFYTENNARGWRDLMAVNLDECSPRKLLAPCRIGDLAYDRSDSSIWGVQHHDGLARVVRIPPPYEFWQELISLSYLEDLYDIDVSPDGRTLTGTLVGTSGRTRLVAVDIEELRFGGGSYEILHHFDFRAPGNFVFSPDGEHLYGSSYSTGASNVWRYDFADSSMNCVTNGETGFFRPLPVGPDSLVAFRYAGTGFAPVMLADATLEDVSAVRFLGASVEEEHPVVRDWVLPSPRDVEIDSLIIENGPYSEWGTLSLNSLYPVVEGYKDFATVGLRFNLTDPAFLHSLHAAASYTPNTALPTDERAHLRFAYQRPGWSLEGAYNRADFYDLFGPTLVSRKGYQLVLSHDGRLVDEQPRQLRYTLRAGGFWGLEELPWSQDVSVTYDNFLAGSLAVGFSNLFGTIGGVEAEKGYLASISLPWTAVRGYFFPRAMVELTRGFLLPLDHSSFWLRAAGGYGHGARDEPFANFYFGGFGNNYVDHRGVNRYRQYYAFPGLEISEANGKTFLKGGVEWTLPPLRFRHLGWPALYATWARLAFFANGLFPNFDLPGPRQEIWDAGAQLNLKVVIFSSLESTFSIGYARAVERDLDPRDELMLSLKILR